MNYKVVGRTHEIYEDIHGYEKPPLPPCYPLTSEQMVADVDGFFTKKAMALLLKLSGYNRAAKDANQRLEDLLRYQYLRGIVPHGPVGSASGILADEPEACDYLNRAARLTLAALNFYQDYYQGKLCQDTYKGKPQEMGQYGNLFGNTVRVPDAVEIYKTSTNNEILIVVKSIFYIVNISSALSGKLSVDELEKCFADIVQDANIHIDDEIYISPSEIAACHPSIQNRQWKKILENNTNKDSLNAVNETLFTVCLDQVNNSNGSSVDMETAAAEIHTGYFSNRWHHASMQIVVRSDAKAGIIYSFDRYIDGNIMGRTTAELYDRAIAEINNNSAGVEIDNSPHISFRAVPWHIDPGFLQEARSDLLHVSEQKQNTIYVLKEYSQNILKGSAFPAVPVFVIALAMTVKQVAGRIPVISQFIDMASYRCMGVGAANVTTSALKELVDQWPEEIPKDKTALRELIMSACTSQQQVCREKRSAFDPIIYILLFFNSCGRLRKFFGYTGFELFRRYAKNQEPATDIFISHPSIDKRIEYIGRPGTRFPYINMMTLHYQVRDDETRLVMANPLSWQEPNDSFIEKLTKNLRALTNVILD